MSVVSCRFPNSITTTCQPLVANKLATSPSCLVVPVFIFIDLLISCALKLNDDDDDDDDELSLKTN